MSLTIDQVDLESWMGSTVACEDTRNGECMAEASWRVSDNCCTLLFCTRHKNVIMKDYRDARDGFFDLHCPVHDKDIDPWTAKATRL
jgi:hypothetical protein